MNSFNLTRSQTGKAGAMFDVGFYTSVFPDLVQKECRRQADKVPVVEFHLGDGTTLDICHILQLSDRWMTVAFFRDLNTCEDMDIGFLPFELVVRITVSFHNAKSRRLGFTLTEPSAPAAQEAKPPGPAGKPVTP